MVKNIIILVIVIILVVLVGTWPLSILAKVFEYISIGLNWLAKAINFFGWNGII